MSAKKFKFISPGVFLSEIDNSQLPKVPGGIGPLIIGRTRRGPGLKPVKVSSFQEFVEVFGEPMPGNEGEDPWRDGNGLLAASYAPYAAQAYLRADINSPVTVIRLLGVAGDDADDSANAHPGWDVHQAFGIFAATGQDTASASETNAKLVGIIYSDDTIGVGAGGRKAGEPGVTVTALSNCASGSNTVKAVEVSSHAFDLCVSSSSGNITKRVSFRKGTNYIRDVLNTSPVATNPGISDPPAGTLAKHYWLGETFEEAYEEVARAQTAHGTGSIMIFTTQLHDNMTDFKSLSHEASGSVTGWVFPQHTGDASNYEPTNLEKLFRFHAIQEGEQGLDLHVCIENIKVADTGNPSPFGRFDVVVKQMRGGRINVVDSFENLNLNPNSDNFIARRIGDQYFQWDSSQKRNKVYGNYPNRSSYIRVEMGVEVGENGPDNPKSVPFGYFGPVRPGTVTEETATDHDLPNTAWAGDNTVIITGSNKLNIEWPVAPHVTVGSLGVDLSAKYVMGSTPYNKADGAETVNYADVNTGMKDYLRKFSMFGDTLSSQITGIAGATSSYSYVFSLDEVVVSGATAPGADLSDYNPTVVNFKSGSHVSGRASVTFQFSPNTAAALNGTIELETSDGTRKTYIGTADGGAANGTVADGKVTFRRGDTAGASIKPIQAAANLKAAIDSENGHNADVADSKFIVTLDGVGGITITQKVRGSKGNKAVTMAAGFAGAIEGAAPTKMTLGTDDAAYTSSDVGTAAALLDLVDSFSMPMVGGNDGVDVTEADPFNMSDRAVGLDSTTRTSYAHASIDRAIELVRDPEALEMNLATMPGITNEKLTTKLVQVCEARADSLAIIDLPNVYIPPAQARCTSFRDRVDNTTPEKSAKELVKRQINSSYGATYYPWVKVRDTISARDVWVPPSVIALGIMGYTEQRDEVWFAPAGFNRGGLNEGNAGLPVLQVSEQLLSSQRDRLYEANINPIASFVSEGLVVFGQKTLQMTPSALDRINVRRLLIFVKKEISRISNGLLFDQNVPATWNRFTGQVVPFLEGVKTRLGLTDFKVVLDRTTTTADLIDRNIMYAKIFLKPARAIEFIAVDFVITRTGASFDD